MKPEVCKGCPLYGAPGPVHGEGPSNASLMILGQNPGPNEIQENRPFVGTSGVLLNRLLQKSSISRMGSYVSNVVKCFVAPGQMVPPGAARHCSSVFLNRELEVGQPKVILTLGQEAFDSLCSPKHLALVHVRAKAKKDPSYWLAGAPYIHPKGFVVVPTMHPAFVARTGFILESKFEHHLKQVKACLDHGVPTLLDLNWTYNPTDQEVIEYAEECGSKDAFGVDIETPYKIEEDELDSITQTTPVNLIGLAASTRHCMGVPPDKFHLLSGLFTKRRQHRPRAWAFGMSFDFGHLSDLYGPMDGIQMADGLMAFHALWSDEKSKDLGTAMAMYTRLPYHKNLEHRDPILYNTLDTIGCLESGEAMYSEMASYPIDMRPLFWRLCHVVMEVKSWQKVGAKYDQSASDRMQLQVLRILQRYEEAWERKFPTVSWSSPKQLVELFTSMGLKVPLKLRKGKGGKPGISTPCVDDEALENLAKSSAVAKLVQLMRSLRKGDDFLNQADANGRYTCRAKVHGQSGGRIQTVDKNVQQIPEKIVDIYPRSTIIPEHPDDIIIAADFSQIEFWLYAYYSKCHKLLDIKNRGEYLYGEFHETIWNEPFFLPGAARTKANRDEDKTPPWKLLITKSWPLGFIYGRGVPDVTGLPISTAKAKAVRNNFFATYPEITAFHNKVLFDAKRQGYLQTPWGRMRRFSNPTAQRGNALAFFGQSSCIDVLIDNLILGCALHLKDMFGPRSHLYFTVHDSGVFNIHGGATLSTGLQAVEYIKNSMEAPLPLLDGFSIPAEVKIGKSWGEVMLPNKYAKLTASTVGEI